MEEKDIKSQYGRVKGANWFPLLYKKDIMVLGQGGIGSWASLFLSRIGCTLHIYDMDTYEDHNMTGQLVGKNGLGKKKTEAMKEMVDLLSPDCEVNCYDKYLSTSPTNEMVICGFDNMEARKMAFRNWKEFITKLKDTGTGIERSCFFQDGRLLAEQLQIFNIRGDDNESIKKYEEEWLFDDEEAPEAECTFKQTSHCAGMIASHMVGFLTNWISNVEAGNNVRQVPFLYEYFIPVNIT